VSGDAEQIFCLHCGEERNDMVPLSDGSPSPCCSDCWEDFLQARESYMAELRTKWSADRRKEEGSGVFARSNKPQPKGRWLKRKPKAEPMPGEDSLLVN
jgi:hypothetical protein